VQIISLSQIVSRARQSSGKVEVLCVQPYDDSTLKALGSLRSWREGIKLTLFGKREKIESSEYYRGLEDVEIIEGDTEEINTARAIETIRADKPSVLMKGLVNTAVFLRVLFRSESVKASGRLISHVSCLEVPGFERLLFITDGTVNVNPDLKTKIGIVENVCEFVRSLGFEKPKIAVIGINERITHSNQDLIDGAVIAKMSERGHFGNCYIDGPMPLDTALSKEAAIKKMILSPVGGEADVLVCSNLESAANLIKGLVHLAHSKTAGLLLGAGFPVVLTSRSDSSDSKEISLAMAILNATGGV
jgi:phosphate butyryltransferase